MVCVQSTKTLEEINLKGDKIHFLMTPTWGNPVHQAGCVQESGPVVGQWPEAGLVNCTFTPLPVGVTGIYV